MSHPTSNSLCTVAEGASRLNFTTEYVRRLIRHGRIRAHKFGGDWRIPSEEIRRIVAGGLDGPALPPLSPNEGSATPAAPVSTVPFLVDQADSAVWFRVPREALLSLFNHELKEAA